MKSHPLSLHTHSGLVSVKYLGILVSKMHLYIIYYWFSLIKPRARNMCGKYNENRSRHISTVFPLFISLSAYHYY